MDTLEVVLFLIQVLVPTGATVLLGMALVFLKHDQDRKLELAKGEVQQLVGIHRDKVEAHKVVLRWAYLNQLMFERHIENGSGRSWPAEEQQQICDRLAAFRLDWGWVQTFCSPGVREITERLLRESDDWEFTTSALGDIELGDSAAIGFDELRELARADLGFTAP